MSPYEIFVAAVSFQVYAVTSVALTALNKHIYGRFDGDVSPFNIVMIQCGICVAI